MLMQQALKRLTEDPVVREKLSEEVLADIDTAIVESLPSAGSLILLQGLAPLSVTAVAHQHPANVVLVQLHSQTANCTADCCSRTEAQHLKDFENSLI